VPLRNGIQAAFAYFIATNRRCNSSSNEAVTSPGRSTSPHAPRGRPARPKDRHRATRHGSRDSTNQDLRGQKTGAWATEGRDGRLQFAAATPAPGRWARGVERANIAGDPWAATSKRPRPYSWVGGPARRAGAGRCRAEQRASVAHKQVSWLDAERRAAVGACTAPPPGLGFHEHRRTPWGCTATGTWIGSRSQPAVAQDHRRSAGAPPLRVA